MPVTDKDLEKKRERLNKLREQVANEEAKAATSTLEQSREIESLQLDAEEARLEAQLAAAKEAAKRSAAKEGATGTLAAVTSQLEAAKTPVTPPGVAVDTNAGSESDDEKKG